MRLASMFVLVLATVVLFAVLAAPAVAASPVVMRPQTSAACRLAGAFNGILGLACRAASHPKTLLHAGKKLITGQPGKAVKTVLGSGSKTASAALGLVAVAAWVTGGARAALHETAKLIGQSTTPNLRSTWFSSAYWRVAAVSALLTLPFLFAAAIQALLRSDPTLLARAAFGYLPLGMLAVGIAAPIAMLLLAASDEMSAIVSTASGNAGTAFLGHIAFGVAASNPFVSFFVALLTVAGAIMLWFELLVREAAVDVIVLMLPLFFAALVWPARRVWALRAVELLVALILSKFAIVAVLALGGAALEHAATLSITSLLTGLTLVLLAAFSPWALLRLLPLHEMASAAATGLAHAPRQLLNGQHPALLPAAASAADIVGAVPDGLREMAEQADGGENVGSPPPATQPRGGAHDDPEESRVEEAAEEAASAVAASGSGQVTTMMVAAGEDDPDIDEGADGPTDGAGSAGGDHPTARSARGLPDLWRRPWGPITLGPDMDPERPVDGSDSSDVEPPPEVEPPSDVEPPPPMSTSEPGLGSDRETAPPPPAGKDVDPPTLPDANPIPPADEDPQ